MSLWSVLAYKTSVSNWCWILIFPVHGFQGGHKLVEYGAKTLNLAYCHLRRIGYWKSCSIPVNVLMTWGFEWDHATADIWIRIDGTFGLTNMIFKFMVSTDCEGNFHPWFAWLYTRLPVFCFMFTPSVKRECSRKVAFAIVCLSYLQ